ncbi:MAG: histidine kinase dimerization/phospho-acceptor domain-containing protein [Planctomycetota bacterium]|jgi:signal transduction histidine kinase
MPRVYLSDLTATPELERALEQAGYEVVSEKPPEDAGGDDLVLVPLTAGITSSLRHAVNNPLTAVLGYLQLLRKREDLPEEAMEKVEKIDVNARRVRELIQKPDDLD